MSTGRIVSSALAVVAVGAGAVVVVGMTQSGPLHDTARPTAPATHAPLPATKTFADDVAAPSTATVAPSTAARPTPAPTSPPARTTPTTIAAATRAAVSVSAGHPTAPAAPATRAAVVHAPQPAGTTAPRRSVVEAPAAARGQSLPLRYSTGSATKVITVTAHSRASTTATVQAWSKAAGGGWRKVGSSVRAYIGSQGMTTSPSESKSATPMGSFGLTQAFGAYGDPGTSLPYHRTNSRYYWMSTTYGSQAKLYNTMQVCPASRPGCYDNGINERLYYETPSYNYAVVIDYNTRNAGHVRVGAGSAFFFHVSTGSPTAGCVAIPQSRLVPIMKWLTPGAHPRMLIGTA